MLPVGALLMSYNLLKIYIINQQLYLKYKNHREENGRAELLPGATT